MKDLLVLLMALCAVCRAQANEGKQEYSFTGFVSVNSGTDKPGLYDNGSEFYLNAMAEYYFADNFSAGVSITANNVTTSRFLIAPSAFVCGSYRIEPTMLVLFARAGAGYTEGPIINYGTNGLASITASNPYVLTAAAGCKAMLTENSALRFEVQYLTQQAAYEYHPYTGSYNTTVIQEPATLRQTRFNVGLSVLL